MSARRVVDGLAVVLVAACAVLLSLSVPFDRFDETWYLRVTQRVQSGEVLYRDVFYGATPLAIYVSRLAGTLFGTEAGVMRAVLATCFAAIVLAAAAVARRLGVGGAGLLLVMLGTLTYGQLLAARASFYTPLAVLLGLITSWLALPSAGEPVPGATSRRRLLAAAAVAGVAFAAKQNVGLLLLAALGAGVVARRDHAARGPAALARELARVATAFVAAAGATLVPVLLSGGGPKLLEYGFFAKGHYLRAAGVPYWAGVRRALLVVLGVRDATTAKWAHAELMFLLPVVALAGLVLAWRVGRQARATTLTLAAFVAAALASTLPRCDAPHLAAAVPLLLVALAYALHVAGSRYRATAAVTVAAVAWMALGAGADVVLSLRRLRSPRSATMPFAHFRGVLGDVASVKDLDRRVSALRALVPAGGPAFLVSSSASFFYLAAGVRNPTPFDYPYVTALGVTGERGIVEAIEAGGITRVCLDVAEPRHAGDPLWPAAIERHARQNMRLVAAREDWELYAPGEPRRGH